jgi:hypothetical protein
MEIILCRFARAVVCCGSGQGEEPSRRLRGGRQIMHSSTRQMGFSIYRRYKLYKLYTHTYTPLIFMTNFDLPCPAHLLCHLQGKMRALLTVFQSNVKSLLPVIGFTCLKAVKTIMMIYG